GPRRWSSSRTAAMRPRDTVAKTAPTKTTGAAASRRASDGAAAHDARAAGSKATTMTNRAAIEDTARAFARARCRCGLIARTWITGLRPGYHKGMTPRARSTAEPLVPQKGGLPKLRDAAAGCTACHLHELGTQTVFG